MKVAARKFQAALVITLLWGCKGQPPKSGLQEVLAADAADHVGEEVVVQGRIAQVSELSNGTTFLNLGSPYPRQDFSVVVFERSRAKFDRFSNLQGLDIRVRGVVREYRGRLEIVLEEPAQLYVFDVEDSPKVRPPRAAYTTPVRNLLLFDGAAGRVSGSLSSMTLASGTYFVDAGAFLGEEAEPASHGAGDAGDLSQSLPIPATLVTGVFITHAHLDHLGRLPLMIRSGFSGPIFLTSGTAQLAQVALGSAIRYEAGRIRDWQWSSAASRSASEKVHWVDQCQWSRRISVRNRANFRGTLGELENALRSSGLEGASPCHECAEMEVASIAKQFRELEYDQRVEVAGDLAVIARSAGHIPGAASFEFLARIEGVEKRMAFSGDLGGGRSPFVDPPLPAPPSDLVVVETTYGGRADSDSSAPPSRPNRFQEDLATVVSKGGIAWIPAFALDRTQQVLFQIEEAIASAELPPGLRVCSQSPDAERYTRIYLADDFARHLKPSSLGRIFQSSARAEDVENECQIVLSSSGMLDHGSSAGLLPILGPRSDVQIFLVGYQSPDTPGGQLDACARSGRKPCPITFFDGGRPASLVVSAGVTKYDEFSSHAHVRELDGWLTNQDKSRAHLFLVHGEPGELEERRRDLLAKGWAHVEVPKRGDLWPLTAGAPD